MPSNGRIVAHAPPRAATWRPGNVPRFDIACQDSGRKPPPHLPPSLRLDSCCPRRPEFGTYRLVEVERARLAARSIVLPFSAQHSTSHETTSARLPNQWHASACADPTRPAHDSRVVRLCNPADPRVGSNRNAAAAAASTATGRPSSPRPYRRFRSVRSSRRFESTRRDEALRVTQEEPKLHAASAAPNGSATRRRAGRTILRQHRTQAARHRRR